MDLCSIASGSSGNCIYVGSDRASVLIDTGLSGRRIEQGLKGIDRSVADIGGIFITHEHSDHIKGLGVLARKYAVPIYATQGTIDEIRRMGSLGTIDPGLFCPIVPDQTVEVGDLELNPFRISHDAADPVAYRISCGEKHVAVATDMGCYDEYTVEHLQGLDALLLESNHDIRMLQAGPYPYYLKQRILGRRGHLSNENAGRLLCEVIHDRLKYIFLGHLSQENNYEALAYETVCAEITLGDNPYRARDFDIQVAKRDQASVLAAV